MKNLKLLRAWKKHSVKGDSFCIDSDETAYFASNKGIYSLRTGSDETNFCSELETDGLEVQHHVVGMEYLILSNSVFVASSSGNLYSYDLAEKKISNIGEVESGIEGFEWSPDQEFLILLTGNKTFVMMTSDFDPLTEKDLSTSEFGESEPVNVGWGSKTTQFHGSEGKGAAVIKQKEPMSALSYDDRLPRICWRDDGEFFAISSIDDTKGYRQLRIWNNEAVLQSTSEILEGIEECLSWRAVGNLITCSQQTPNKHKIIFVEKNGLKHGEFTLPFKPHTFKVTSLLWSNDSSVLAVVVKELKENSVCQVMLWTTGNYHWYLKQQFTFDGFSPNQNLIINWCPNHPLEMYCYNQSNEELSNVCWTQTLIHSPPQYKCSDSFAVSIDNENILVSPFGNLIVPPPMCGYKFIMNSSVQSVFFASDKPAFGAYLGDLKLAIFIKGDLTEESSEQMRKESNACRLQLVAAGGNGFRSQVQPYAFHSIFCIKIVSELSKQASCVTWPYSLSHWTWVKNNSILCVCYTANEGNSSMYSILHIELNLDSSSDTKEVVASKLFDLKSAVVSMCTNECGATVAIQYESGIVISFDIDEILNKPDGQKEEAVHNWTRSTSCLMKELVFSQPNPEMAIVNKRQTKDESSKDVIIALDYNGTLEFDGLTILFVTSYFVQGGFLFYTTTDHLLHIFQFDPTIQNGKCFEASEQKIERNARIIFVPPESTKVILQMPRGNLETIHPRVLVLASILKHLDKLEYNKAFTLAKVHRIDLNVLYDYNPEKFLENIKLFTEQLQSKDLNLFLADLKPSCICKNTYNVECITPSEGEKMSTYFENKVNILCDKIREVLDPNTKKHLLPYLATFALKKPPSLDQALLKIKNLKDSNGLSNDQDVVNEALDFLLYLIDVNKLIDVAFGTYDLELTIMVAQKSNKDPKEFLPLYNDLQNLEENYRKYKIDMQLQRYKNALIHISKCSEHFDDVMELIKDQRLYLDALYLYPESSEENKMIWMEYGNYLECKGYFDEAGLIYHRANAKECAYKAYRESCNWRECLTIAYELNYSEQKILGTCQYIAERLKNNGNHLEAGYLFEHFVKDIEEAIVTLLEGCEWSSALLLMTRYKRLDIVETHMKPALMMLHKTLIPDLNCFLNSFETHLSRLKYLRSPEKKKLDEEKASMLKYMDDDQFSEIGSVSDITSESSRLSGSIMTRKSSRSRRKQQLKKYRLKEGAPDEDLALIVAMSEIVRRVDSLKDNFLDNIRVLVQYRYDDPAREIQTKMQRLVVLIESEMPYIWPPNQTTENATPISPWAYGPSATANAIAASIKVNDKSEAAMKQDPQLAAPPWRKDMELFLPMF